MNKLCDCGRLPTCIQRTTSQVIGRKRYGGDEVYRCETCRTGEHVVCELAAALRNQAWAELMENIRVAPAAQREEAIKMLEQIARPSVGSNATDLLFGYLRGGAS